MKLYIAIWNDRHSDITAHPFSDPNKAIEWAKTQAKKYAREDDDYQEHDYGKDDGWIFFAEYSCESDCIYVIETELDAECVCSCPVVRVGTPGGGYELPLSLHKDSQRCPSLHPEIAQIES